MQDVSTTEGQIPDNGLEQVGQSSGGQMPSTEEISQPDQEMATGPYVVGMERAEAVNLLEALGLQFQVWHSTTELSAEMPE